MTQFDSSEKGVLNILEACGIKDQTIKCLSDLIGLSFEFRYKYGIICQRINSVTIVESEDSSGNKYPQIEISLDMNQSRNFICLACMIKNTLIMPQKPQWRLLSNLGRLDKEYLGAFKMVYLEI